MLLLLLLISIMVCSQLTGDATLLPQMSKRQAKRKRRQLQQNQARQARAAQLADAAADGAGPAALLRHALSADGDAAGALRNSHFVNKSGD